MKATLMLLATLLLCACAGLPDPASDDAATCAAGGGCHTGTMKALVELVREAFDKGLARGAARCTT